MLEIEELKTAYRDPLSGAIAAAHAGIPIVGVSSNTVPWEPFVAAGCFPVILNPSLGSPLSVAAYADRYMEAVFEDRIRAIFDMVASGVGVGLRSFVIPRTSEQEHKLFLYLREVSRMGVAPSMPEVYLYNLLHTHSQESQTFGIASTRKLLLYAAQIGNGDVTVERLRAAIETGNRCRKGLRELQSLRTSSINPVSGTDALQLIGASYFMDREAYASHLSAIMQSLPEAPPLRGKRLLIKGARLSFLDLHRAIEHHSAVVVAEDDWWGSRSALPDLDPNIDPAESIFNSCFFHAQSPRMFPPAVADEWFLSMSKNVDAVIFYLPFEDDVYGWDYPRWRRILNSLGIPHLMVRDDARTGMSAGWHEEFEGFLSSL